MQDSVIANNGGKGNVDPKKVKDLTEAWGRLPERDRVRALQEMTAGMSPAHREAIENYFRNLASGARKQ